MNYLPSLDFPSCLVVEVTISHVLKFHSRLQFVEPCDQAEPASALAAEDRYWKPFLLLQDLKLHKKNVHF